MPEPLRDVIARHGLQATKALGPEFHPRPPIAGADRGHSRAARRARRVYEVGPGPGGLTRALLDAGAKVVAVERDRRCLPALAELEAEFAGRLRIISGDALEIDERAEAGDGAHIVANLPYNVGTALLLRWLAGAMAAMVVVADPDVPARGRGADRRHGRTASITAGCRSRRSGGRRPRIAMAVHRSAFVPPPKVASAVVHIVPADEPDGRRSAASWNG